jgi:hypothetical protein
MRSSATLHGMVVALSQLLAFPSALVYFHNRLHRNYVCLNIGESVRSYAFALQPCYFAVG